MAKQIIIDGKNFLVADDMEEAFRLWGWDSPEMIEWVRTPPPPPPPCVVYVLEMGNGTVKIGVTQDMKRRKGELSKISGVGIKNEWHTDLLPRGVAYKVEHLCHDEFKEQRTLGEYFNVPFDDACFAVALYGIIVSEGEKYKAKHGIKRRY